MTSKVVTVCKPANLDRKLRTFDIATTCIDTRRVSSATVKTLLVWALNRTDVVAIGYDDAHKIAWSAGNVQPDNILPFRVSRMPEAKLVQRIRTLRPTYTFTNDGSTLERVMGSLATSAVGQLYSTGDQSFSATLNMINAHYRHHAPVCISSMDTTSSTGKCKDKKKKKKKTTNAANNDQHLTYEQCLELDSTMTRKEYQRYCQQR